MKGEHNGHHVQFGQPSFVPRPRSQARCWRCWRCRPCQRGGEFRIRGKRQCEGNRAHARLPPQRGVDARRRFRLHHRYRDASRDR